MEAVLVVILDSSSRIDNDHTAVTIKKKHSYTCAAMKTCSVYIMFVI